MIIDRKIFFMLLKKPAKPTPKKTNTRTGSDSISQPNPLVGGTSQLEEKTKGKKKGRKSKKPKKSSAVGGAAAAVEIALSPMTSTSVTATPAVTATVNKPSAPSATPPPLSNPLDEVVLETHVDQTTGKRYSYNPATKDSKWLD